MVTVLGGKEGGGPNGGAMVDQTGAIGQSVGRYGANKERDVKLVQTLLNRALTSNDKFKGSGVATLSSDGKCGPRTIEAIEKFQQRVLGWSGSAVDGTVSPNQATWKALNGNVAGTSAIKPRPALVDGFVAFRQGEYKTVTLGDGDLNISGFGCALCTLTMAATVIGSPTNHWPPDLLPGDLTPPITNQILLRAGAFTGSLLTMAKAAQGLGMTYDEYGMRPGAWEDKLKGEDVLLIESNLVAGNPVAANVDYKGDARGDHWILVTHRSGNGTFGAIDPATGRAVTLTKSLPQLSNVSTTMNRDLKGGVLYGYGQGGSADQQKYVVKRFGLLAPVAGGFSAAL